MSHSLVTRLKEHTLKGIDLQVVGVEGSISIFKPKPEAYPLPPSP